MEAVKVNEHEHLKRGKAESDALFLSFGDGAIVTDAHGNVSRVNQAALDILGYTADEVMGKWYPNTIQAEYEDGTIIPNLERPITRVFMTGKVVRARLYYRRHDGSRIAIDLSVAPVLVDGQPSGAIEVFRDITQEVVLEKAKDEFISLASHQLRTPATGVKQYASMLLEGYAGDLTPSQKAMVQSIYDSNERQITIVNDLLKVAHVDAGQVQIERQKIDLVQLVRDVLDEQAHVFKSRHQKIIFKHDKPVIEAFVDPKNIRMVLENVIDNASKYTPDKKTVTIKVGLLAKRNEITVIDEGVGIVKSDIPKIFQKFSRLSNPLSVLVGGTGLGLYWARKIVQLHEGTIKVSSVIGKGSVFTICIPNTKRATTKRQPRVISSAHLTKRAVYH